MKQLALAIGPHPTPTLDSFITGTNGAVLAHLRGLDLSGAPLYLWGPPGAGKTHLLHGLVQACRQQGQGAGWFGARDPLPWRFDESWSLIVLDECDAFDEDRQQAAFTMFVQATTHAIKVAASGRLPPVDLALRDDLRTRLGWGHVFALEPLTEPEVRSALRREADRRGIFLSDEVMDYLLTRFARDLKHLMALLDRLDGFALSQHRAVTVPLLKKMLAEEGASS